MVFIKMLSYADEHKNKLYQALILILLSVLVGVIPYLLLHRLLELFMEGNNIQLQSVMTLTAAIGVAHYIKSWLLGKGLTASHEMAYDTLMGIRRAFAEKLMKLPMGDIQDRGVGAYKINLVDDIEQIEILLAHMIPEGVPYLLSPLVVLLTLFVIDWRLALLAMGSIPFGLVPIIIMMVSGVEKMKLYYESEKEMNKTIVEYISGMEVIKIFNRTTGSFEKYVKNINNYKDFTLEWFKASWTFMAMYSAVLPCTILLLLPVGLIFYINGSLTFSTLIFSLLLTMSIGMPLVKLVEFIPAIPNLSYKFEELEKTFEGRELMAEDKGLSPDNYNVNFSNVSFAYDEIKVVDQVNFEAKAGEVTAIVGESGSGKSTLARLLVHYWDIDEGSINIGGVDIRDMSMDKLMEIVSFVSQDTFLFNIPIIENIRLGKPGATDEEVMEAAKAAECHSFITELSNGYYTMPGNSGDKLSGGEKQRITIARAVLKNAPVIVLDEATSSTDAENEDKIQEAINKLVVGKTLIVIAHHLSTIVQANQIIVMNKGKLSAKGTHGALLEQSKDYKQLWDAYIESTQWDLSVKEINDVEYSQTNHSAV